MEKKKIVCAVIVLNYNTVDDAITAARSVLRFAENPKDYIICIADNASTKNNDRKILQEFNEDNIITLILDENRGYAQGNNIAIRFVLEKYDPKFIVIMNPDVQLIEYYTIDKLIARIDSKDERIIGGQPLVWNCNYRNDPRSQINIRQVPNFFDLCILSFYPFRILFRKRFRRINYLDKIPYDKEIEYCVPSGAFFLIKREFFEQVGLFDENTFLYNEENILGFKIHKANKKMLFIPELMVRHEHSKSIGNGHSKFNWNAAKYSLDSRLYYSKEYLKIGIIGQSILRVLSFLSMIIKYLIVRIR